MRSIHLLPTSALLAAGLAVSGLPALAALDHVPVLDVEKSCHAAQTYGMGDTKATYNSCMQDEKEARTQLSQKWSKFKPSSRRACAPVHPIPSYVEMLTCLEMYQDALLPEQGGGTPSGGASSGGAAPNGYVHDSPSPRPLRSLGPRPAGSF